MTDQNLQAVAFPKLDERQIAMLEGCAGASRRRYRDGQKLIEAGARDFTFFVVVSGEIAIVDESGEAPKTIAILRRGEFSGDVAHLTGGPSLISAIARGDCDVYEVSSEGVREIINRFPDLGDVILKAFIARRQLLREMGSFTGLRVIGSRYSPDTLRIRDFLSRNRLPFTWLDLEDDPQVSRLLKQFGVSEADTPVVAWGGRLLLRNPSDRELGEALGIRVPLQQAVYDLVVVGAGPAGLAAAVYGASEGLNTVILERAGPGGQAGGSMRIENYLGFPTGLTGSELAERAVVQAGKFGARLLVPAPVTGLTFENAYPVLRLDGGETVTAKCLLIATGADYNRLTAERCEEFEGRGVYYAATPNEAPFCRGAEAVIVGAGNSAGQAAVYLAGQARKVYLVVRGDDLYESMSSYLAWRIQQTPNIEILYNTTVRRMSGDGHLASVEIVNSKTGEVRTIETPALFSFIGTAPRTDWLPEAIERDGKDFVRTGAALAQPTGPPVGNRSCWRPATPACSPPGMCGRVRSSVSLPPLARGRWWSSSCTST